MGGVGVGVDVGVGVEVGVDVGVGVEKNAIPLQEISIPKQTNETTT